MTDDASATPTEPADEEPTAHADKEPTAPADKEPTAPADKKPTAAERIRGAAKTGIKLGVAVAILAWLFSRGDLDPDTIKRPLETPGTVLLVLCLGTIGLTMSGVRWWLLLGAVGIRIPVLAAVRLCWIGHFWNMVIPGAVSGDLVKMFYIGRQVPEAREESWGTVIADRLIGLGALVSVSTVAALTQLDFIVGRAELRASFAFMVLILTGFLGLATVLALGIGTTWKITAWIGDRLPFRDSIVRLYSTLRALRKRPGRVLAAYAISVTAHLVSVSCAYLFGRLFTDALDISQYYALVPMAFFSNAIPLTPGGIGVGEAVLGDLFTWTGAAAAPGELARAGVSVMIWHRLYFYVLAGVGGVLHAIHREKTTS